MIKKCTWVYMPTEKPTDIVFDEISKRYIDISYVRKDIGDDNIRKQYPHYTFQYLHILSDDLTEEWNYVYLIKERSVALISSISEIDQSNMRKVIASTDNYIGILSITTDKIRKYFLGNPTIKYIGVNYYENNTPKTENNLYLDDFISMDGMFDKDDVRKLLKMAVNDYADILWLVGHNGINAPSEEWFDKWVLK